MHPATAHRPPQTLRQAKRAFQKAGAAPRFSAVEQRRLERAAELRGRAEAIREKEKTRKANAKKRAEKEEREREKRRRMGVPEPVHEGYISPRQVRMGVYLGKRKTDGDGDGKGKEGEGAVKKFKEDVEKTARVSAARNSPSGRQPLGEISANVTPGSHSQKFKKKDRQQDTVTKEDWGALLDSCSEREQEEEPVQTAVRYLPAASKPTKEPSIIISQRSRSRSSLTANTEAAIADEDWAALLEGCSENEQEDCYVKAAPKKPSSVKLLSQEKSKNVTPRSTSQKAQAANPRISTVEEDWAYMLESNSQVERDIFTGADTPLLAPIKPSSKSLPSAPPPSPVDHTADLLALISTQDIFDCDQLSPLKPAQSPHDYGPALQEGDITDQELEEFTKVYKLPENTASDTPCSPAAVPWAISNAEEEERLRLPDDWEPNLLFPSDEEEFELEEDSQEVDHENTKGKIADFDLSEQGLNARHDSAGAPIASPIFRQASIEGSIHIDYTLSTQELAGFDDTIVDHDISPSQPNGVIQSTTSAGSFGTDEFNLSTQDLRDLGA